MARGRTREERSGHSHCVTGARGQRAQEGCKLAPTYSLWQAHPRMGGKGGELGVGSQGGCGRVGAGPCRALLLRRLGGPPCPGSGSPAPQLLPACYPGTETPQEGTWQQAGCLHRSVHLANGDRTLRPTATRHCHLRKEEGEGDRLDLLLHRPWPLTPRPRLPLHWQTAHLLQSDRSAAQAPAAGSTVCRENCLCVWGMKLESS